MKPVLGAFFLLAAVVSWGQTSKEDRTATLTYGIETEVLELVQALHQEKNTDYNPLLVAAYSHARTEDLKDALLLFFLDLKDAGLEDQAIQELSAPEKKGNSLLLNAVSYLTALKSAKAKDTLVALIPGTNKVLALAAIRAMGKLGAADKVDDLMKLYQDSETDPNYKPDLIWTFGELKAAAAVDLLLKEYDENDAQPFLQKAILEALGKIGDPRGWDKVQAALASTNTDLRTAAVATLTSYPGQGDTASLLTSALRDGQATVREAAAQAAKTAPLPGLKDLLVYRVKKDPEAKVRIAAFRALAAYNDGPALVLGFLSDRKTDPAVWKESLTMTLENKYPGAFDTLKKVLEEDNKDKNGTLSAVVVSTLLPQRDAFRSLFGLALASDKVPARLAALRAVAVGKFTEYQTTLQTLAAKDPDAGVRNQSATILKDWAAPPPSETSPK